MSSIRALAVALALGLALAAMPFAGTASAEDTSLEQVLAETASTPAQHQALAKHYHAKANAAKAEAAHHRAMKSSYSGMSMPTAKARAAHCDKLASLADSEAAEYDKLAASHEAQAK